MQGIGPHSFGVNVLQSEEGRELDLPVKGQSNICALPTIPIRLKLFQDKIKGVT